MRPNPTGGETANPYMSMSIQRVTGVDSIDDLTVLDWSGSEWTDPTPGDGVTVDGNIVNTAFGPELNIGGKYIMGASGKPFKFTSDGDYLITFALEDGSPIFFDGNTKVANDMVFYLMNSTNLVSSLTRTTLAATPTGKPGSSRKRRFPQRPARHAGGYSLLRRRRRGLIQAGRISCGSRFHSMVRGPRGGRLERTDQGQRPGKERVSTMGANSRRRRRSRRAFGPSRHPAPKARRTEIEGGQDETLFHHRSAARAGVRCAHECERAGGSRGRCAVDRGCLVCRAYGAAPQSEWTSRVLAERSSSRRSTVTSTASRRTAPSTR